MGKIKIIGNVIEYRRENELTRIEPWGEDCVRIRSTRNPKILMEDWTLLPAQADHATIDGDENFATLTNGHVSITMDVGNPWFGGHIIVYRDGKEILHNRIEGDYDSRNVHTEGNNYRVKMIFNANAGEHFYGLGQEQEDVFDRKGSTSEIIHYNTKSSLPVAYSSLGYGFLWNNPAPGRVELTKNHTMFVADSAYQADLLVFAGSTPAETMKIYGRLTGFAPKFPGWAAGFWQCKLRYESQDELLSVAREYKRRGIPIDAVVIDYFHWTEQGEWKFDPKYWPDPKAMVDELNEMGIQLVVSIWPTINPKSENYVEMSEGRMLIRTEAGEYGTFQFFGMNTFIDATNPDTRAYVWNKVKQNYYSYGIKNFWLDEAEPEVHPQEPGNLSYYAGNGAQAAQLYPYYYVKTFYDGLKEAGEEEIILLTRACYPGSQRVGALCWNGDIPSTFHNLKMSIKTGLSMGMCGIPWWNSDIGGFLSGDTESDEFRELIVRWFQFGVFCPVMRLHGARVRESTYEYRHPGIIEPSGGQNEIWCFGEENYPVLKELIELRERLRDYICACMAEASESLAPIMRPMFWQFYEDSKCYELEDQYMFGDDILFAPIYERGATERAVYLPAGADGKQRWVNVRTREVIEGGQTITCFAKVSEFIAFVKEGAKVLEVF